MSELGLLGSARTHDAPTVGKNRGSLPGLPPIANSSLASTANDHPIGARLRSWVGHHQNFGAYRTRGKRALDIFLVILALPVVIPMIVLLAVAVAADGGPAFFRQTRIGRGGRHFECLKLRTMAVDSDRLLKEILETDPVALSEWTEKQKLTNDPRITRLGRFMRKTSLDELPQLLNVLMGDMSLVGPRPVVPKELERYGEGARHYLRVRPGLTGAWQVSRRNETSYDERVQLDMDYVHRHSLFHDIWIMAKTLGVVVAATGR